MVQLKLNNLDSDADYNEFQFHNGTIKTNDEGEDIDGSMISIPIWYN